MQATGTELQCELYTMAFANTKPRIGSKCFSVAAPRVQRGDILRLSLLEPAAWLNDQRLRCEIQSAERSRKFIVQLRLVDGTQPLTRLCSHYLPHTQKPIGKDYYFGDDYVDYPNQTNTSMAVQLVGRYCSTGRLLDIGCALGLYTKAFLDAHYDAQGIDVSPFAIVEASQRVGTARARQCNLDTNDIPFDGTFDVLWMWDVLEHFADPWNALLKATAKVCDGAWLFLHTSNSDSLTHRIFGQDWEGYTDYSHHGVDQVTATNLRSWLDRLGWETVQWNCNSIWVEGVDPVVLRLKQLINRIPEMQMLLLERDLGDYVSLVARKRRQARSVPNERN
jgi:2-polyprenyl-3-methyl-5-hydroxy-6-metoxy-1,4-benzoquinol methylase